jgi:RNA polymerase sigma-70 factor (ECF subfamily)
MDQGSAEQERRWSGLMRAAQDGDAAAYSQLLREVAPFVRSLARRRIRGDDAVEDVVQEVLLCLHRVRGGYDPARPFTPWLAAICSRRAIDAVRRKTRIAGYETVDETAYETFADPASNKELEAGAAAQLVASLVEDLPPGQRQALELLKLKELSLAEASAVSGQSIGGLKVSVHRAIKTLRVRLGMVE